MADCSKTVEFLREFGRMCGNGNCQECPIWREKAIAMPCVNYIQNHQAEVLTIVQKWSDEHPALTWYGKMQQMLPKANLVALTSGIQVCPSDVFGESAPNWRNGCSRICAECWTGEYKEEEHG